MKNFGNTKATKTPGVHGNDELVLTRLERWLPPLLSVIAGMADLTGFFTPIVMPPVASRSSSHERAQVDHGRRYTLPRPDIPLASIRAQR